MHYELWLTTCCVLSSTRGIDTAHKAHGAKTPLIVSWRRRLVPSHPG